MPSRIKKSLLILIAPLALTACGLDLGLLEAPYRKPPPVPVSTITTPPAPNQPPVPALYCRAGRGEALFAGQWHPFAESTFALEQGRYVVVTLPRKYGLETMSIQALFDNGGQKIIFCPVVTGAAPGQRVACASLYAVEEDLETGFKRTFEIPNAVRGGAITCAYRQAGLKSLELPN